MKRPISMTLGKRKPKQVLGRAGFDEFIEKLCAPYYKQGQASWSARHSARSLFPDGVVWLL
jgi:hypothetical protein